MLSSRVGRKRTSSSLGASVLAGATALGFAVLGLGGVAGAQTPARGVIAHQATSAPSGNNGTTVDPLQYNCGNDHPSCGHVGSSFADFNGTSTEIVYSENYYCDANVSSGASSGCEVGAPASAQPSASSAGGTGTSLGNTTSGDTLYIPVPLGFTPSSPTQCPAASSTVTCIDHPNTVDLSRIAAYLPNNPSPSSVANAFVPAHDHVVTTRNNGNPEWWNVKVVPVTSQAALTTIETSKQLSASQLQPFDPSSNPGGYIPSNMYLFFQVLPGTVPSSVATNPANLNADNYPPGNSSGPAPAPAAADQSETGSTFNNLKVDCAGGGANCSNIGIARGYVSGTPGVGTGQDTQLLYSEEYSCPTPSSGVRAGSSSGCEAGSPAGSIPPGVGGNGVVPTAANSAPGVQSASGSDQIDPLYIPVPLGFTPKYSQCPTAITCIDHPMTVDLSALAPYLPGKPSASSLTNVALPSHDHVVRTRNGDQPEWWNVEVVPVTSQAQLDTIETAKNLTVAQEQPFSPTANPGGSIDTNVYLWFQTLPGGAVHTPGPGASVAAATPTAGTCSTSLPASAVVAGADLPDGTGYVETDRAGDVAAFGGAACYGSLTGVHLNKPIVGIAVDRNTGGYWLVASDGGIFNFNAPFLGSTGNVHLNKPIVGISTDINSQGYTLVASDGGVFPFGEPFLGSTGNVALNKPVVGMAYDYASGGYYLVASDGGVFDFGGAKFWGSTGNVHLNKPIVAISPLLTGTGYTLIASDGGTFQEGAAPFIGSLGATHLNFPIVAAGTDFANGGFTDFAADGGVFSFGSPFYGSAA
ncbi:hypothetical protein K6U06_08365 [Acidiferrimicrobium sp. IK]|uniref:hypothetical protein n=1 Tax=Acidiferrimicrobium sp. IK TaxID=2871700 RepID=UPI0021CB6221|nr:hypothetical protein [Acidiferrimicrobium sp. IK]MCU4184372.1 hypothetical protein [Acidiferrimicrobium sp. IK]